MQIFGTTPAKALATVSVLFAFAQEASAADTQLLGNDLVKALNGQSFSCTLEGKSLMVTFGTFDKNGKILYKGTLAGTRVSAGYKMDKTGNITQANTGKARSIFRDKKGQLTIKGPDLPTTRCVVK